MIAEKGQNTVGKGATGMPGLADGRAHGAVSYELGRGPNDQLA